MLIIIQNSLHLFFTVCHIHFLPVIWNLPCEPTILFQNEDEWLQQYFHGFFFCHTLWSIEAWRFKCVLFSLMNILSYIQWEWKKIYHFIMITGKNPAFQSSLVKTVFCYPKTSPYINSYQRQKINHCIFALVGYSEATQLWQRELSWV